ncbi:right-handed parallel beta-helix repeat-containing protein [Paenibacillus sp. HJGM_3]|uniref:right-handed parallel beta-helix repeat-containing protein n=1 Tax=Paenibacillus sp. HJGM_3 TaxID=3379816 RepID=UPI00385B5428
MKKDTTSSLSRLSGSSKWTMGTIESGTSRLVLDEPIDFEAGQGILIAGAGEPCREVLSLVIEEEPKAGGVIELNLPGEPVRTMDIAVMGETVTLRLARGCSTSGYIAIVLDTVEFLIPVKAGESAVEIADRIRDWFFEGWTNGGAVGTDTVQLTSVEPGPRRNSYAYSQRTGVEIELSMKKGTRTSARSIAANWRDQAYEHWIPGGYANSNVVFFVAKREGAGKGETARYESAATGATGRLEVVQFGSSLLAEIADVSGRTITLDRPAPQMAAGVYVGHDDSAALQAAFDRAAGNEMHLPPGTYMCAQPLKPGAATVIRGAGKTSTVIQFQALGPGIQLTSRANDVYIGHLQVKNVCSPDVYYGEDSEVHGIRIIGAKRSVIEHCWLDNCDDAGIRAETNSFGTKLLYNIIVNTAEGSGIEIIRGEECLIQGNFIKMSSQHAVRLCGARKPIAVSNVLENNFDGFSIQGFGMGRDVNQRTQDFLVEGNTIKDQVRAAIVISNQTNSGLIQGNWLEGRQGQIGIELRTSVIRGRISTNFDLTIQGNLIKGFQQAVVVRGDQHGMIIKGNTIKDFSANEPNAAYGICLDCEDIGDLRNVEISANTFVCKVHDQWGIRLFRASSGTSVHVHNNTFTMRRSDSDPIPMAERCILNEAAPGYNETALISVKTGSSTLQLPDHGKVTAVTIQDTNGYCELPV